MLRNSFLCSYAVILIICVCSGFQLRLNKRINLSSRLELQLNSISSATSLIRKGKKKEVDTLKKEIESEGSNHYITKFLSDGSYTPGMGPCPVKFYDFTYSPPGTLKVFVEYNQKSKTGFVMGIPGPEVLGGILRDTAHCVVVSMDKRSGGSTVSEFIRFTKEQYRARRSQPGPVPVMWNDYIVDELQIIQAAALGAGAVTLTPEMTDNLAGLLSACHRLNLGAVVFVKTVEEAAAAVEAGARSLCLYGMEETKLVEVRQSIPESVLTGAGDNGGKPVQVGAKLRSEGDFSTFTEVDTAWLLRDRGFSFVWPSTEAVFANNVNDVYTTLLALRAKACREYYSPRQYFMERTKEGSKEYLGDILY